MRVTTRQAVSEQKTNNEIHSDFPYTIAFTPGDPAGIGLDLAVQLTHTAQSGKIVMIVDSQLLNARANKLGKSLLYKHYYSDNQSENNFEIEQIDCNAPVVPGLSDKRHAQYVLNTLNRAIEGCISGEFDALVTGPVNKQMMSNAGLDFMGHTEYLANKCDTNCPVMLLQSNSMKVALATTHIPLKDVASTITCERIVDVVRVLHQDLQQRFGIPSPRIAICGLNPHAGEGGELGLEEVKHIKPAVDLLQQEQIGAYGPFPADTIFARHRLHEFDVVLAMYHDQGLPVIKHSAFGDVVNVTLGLPIIRTSVDHGTAYEIAGTGKAEISSLLNAISTARLLCERRVK